MFMPIRVPGPEQTRETKKWASYDDTRTYGRETAKLSVGGKHNDGDSDDAVARRTRFKLDAKCM